MANKVAIFFREVKVELGKVSWSTRDELKSSVTVVIASMLLLGVFIWVCDFMFVRVVNIIIKL